MLISYESFPIVEIAIKLFIFILCLNSSGERSFSVLKLVKNYKKTLLSNEIMSLLSLISIVNIFLKSVGWNNIIKKFAAQKAKK
jgi:hypothetical protein